MNTIQNKLNISIISGSSRKYSNSLRLCKAIEKILRNNPDIQNIFLLDIVENDFPSIGRQEIEYTSLSEYQRNFINSLENSQLILICLPEYNWNTNPELINIFHQIGKSSFKQCFENKVFATAGVSTGRGGRRPCLEFHILLNKIISFMGAYGVVCPMIFESHETDKNIDNEGNLKENEIYKKALNNFILYILTFTKKWHHIL